MTGWRLGYSMWPKPLLDNARKLAVNSHPASTPPRQGRGLRPPPPAGRGPYDALRNLTGAGRRWTGWKAKKRLGPLGGNRRPATSAAPISASMAKAISASPMPTRWRTSSEQTGADEAHCSATRKPPDHDHLLSALRHRPPLSSMPSRPIGKL
ncbi:hypothetical protein FQR65_LT20813 [Abscondita terminalis]|nr:hypothetical protein FQR65_LT20813 [Abscondita terminalis]